MNNLIDRLLAGTGGGKHSMDLQAEAAHTITRLTGEALVMLDLLSEALGIIDTIEPETATESEYLNQIKDEMRALLVAKAGRPA